MWALTSKRQNRSFCVLLSLLFGLFFVLAWSPFFHVSSLLITSSLVRPRWCLHLSLLSLFSSAGVILSLSSLLPSSSNYLSKMDWRSARKEKKSLSLSPLTMSRPLSPLLVLRDSGPPLSDRGSCDSWGWSLRLRFALRTPLFYLIT